MRFLFLSVICLFTTCLAEAGEEARLQLANEVIVKLKIPERHDYDVRSVPPSVTDATAEGRLQIWLGEVRVREMGWSKIKDAFIEAFAARYTEIELKELLVRLDDPLMAKVLSSELELKPETAKLRAKLFQDYWARYNSGEFSPPASVQGK